MTRKPVVAGRFYPASASILNKEISCLVTKREDKIDAMGVVSPHAGYMYSGAIAGEVLSSIKPKPTYIILGPNHTGTGKPFGIDSGRRWKTPLGEIGLDSELCETILRRCRHIEKDNASHNYEHSIEVQLPFLQYLGQGFSFVPIAVSYADPGIYMDIGAELAEAIKELKKDVTIIASSDMTHYESQQLAKQKDMMAIEKILALDIEGFLHTVKTHDISMCGFAPTAIMMQACVRLGAKKARLIKYATSGDVSGDYSAVVGYAGIVIY
ncbi:MAG: AmmeMemoRadiSam system protein B [Omnitrophica bacterium RBG_13_46_9]|nr:MAG: AmmeMemoRadiSam system protein B [Omnitrophica bacterium RBG_13_46_9]